MYHQLPLLDAIVVDNHKITRRMDNVTTLSSEILENMTAIVARTSPTPLIDTVNLHPS
jgi:hypothetical protein